MVLESLVTPEDAEKSPWKIAALSFVFALVAVAVAEFSGLESKGIVVVAVASISAIPFIYSLFNYEESWYEAEKFLGSRTLARHFPVVVVLAAFFVGLLAGFTLANVLLPQESVESIFNVQHDEVKAITATFSGRAIDADKTVAVFETIFLHNLQVLALIIAFSLLYGAGATTIIAWNASVISVFAGSVAKTFAAQSGAPEAALAGAAAALLGIAPHGTFELLSYLTGALAGGILSAAFVRKSHLTESFIVVAYDAAKLFAIAIIFLAIGAAIESPAVG